MPDWSYQTIFKPLLFQFPAAKSRDITLGAMRLLSKLPLGPSVISFMGHMKPDASLEKELFGVSFNSPVGLSGKLDPKMLGTKPLSQFGFGYMEVGPVTVDAYGSVNAVERNINREQLTYPSRFSNCGLQYIKMQLKKIGNLPTPIGLRIAPTPGNSLETMRTELETLCLELNCYADFFILQLDWCKYDEQLLHVVLKASEKPVLLSFMSDDTQNYSQYLMNAINIGIQGFVIDEELKMNGEGFTVGREAKQSVIDAIRFIRTNGGGVPIISSGGIHDPQDALDLLEAGADLVQMHSGLVFSGPGLPKRINEAVLSGPKEAQTVNKKGWLGFGLFGIGIFLGGLLALLFGLTAVVLPYDEKFLGLTREQIIAIDPKLLHFMSHDRITLAGTMISASVMYWQLSFYAVRYRIHWAKVAIVTAGTAGFLGFFLFIGYGYFDWLHFIFFLLLIPPFMYGIFHTKDVNKGFPSQNVKNDTAWRRSLWGQLMFVSLGIALVIAGITISIIGMNDVFVKEDLSYLGIAPEKLNEINDRLIPLIAHDRAGFGGALFADGLLLLMLALWGYREGHRWVWYAFLFGGIPGFFAAFGTHFHIGYVDWWHLFPAVIAVLLYLGGLYYSYSFLFKKR